MKFQTGDKVKLVQHDKYSIDDINKVVSTMKIFTTKHSTLIKRISYCEKCKILRIKFYKGGVWEYSDVSMDVYIDIIDINMNMESVGKYYITYIRGKYPSRKIVDDYDSDAYRMDSPCLCKETTTAEKTKTELSDEKIIQCWKYCGRTYYSKAEAEKVFTKNKMWLEKSKFDMALGLLNFTKDQREAIFANRDALKKIL